MSVESTEIAARMLRGLPEDIPKAMSFWLSRLVSRLADMLAPLPGALEHDYGAISELFGLLPDMCHDPEVLTWLVKKEDEHASEHVLMALAEISENPIADILDFWNAAGRTNESDIDLVCAVVCVVTVECNHFFVVKSVYNLL